MNSNQQNFTFEAYHKDQEAFDKLNPRERELEEHLYHLRQIHRLLWMIFEKTTVENAAFLTPQQIDTKPVNKKNK